MEKEENRNNTSVDKNQDPQGDNEKPKKNLDTENKPEITEDPKQEIKELTPEEKIAELEDKLTRTFAEMENQEEGLKKKRKMLLNMVVIVLQKKLLI